MFTVFFSSSSSRVTIAVAFSDQQLRDSRGYSDQIPMHLLACFSVEEDKVYIHNNGRREGENALKTITRHTGDSKCVFKMMKLMISAEKLQETCGFGSCFCAGFYFNLKRNASKHNLSPSDAALRMQCTGEREETLTAVLL